MIWNCAKCNWPNLVNPDMCQSCGNKRTNEPLFTEWGPSTAEIDAERESWKQPETTYEFTPDAVKVVRKNIEAGDKFDAVVDAELRGMLHTGRQQGIFIALAVEAVVGVVVAVALWYLIG